VVLALILAGVIATPLEVLDAPQPLDVLVYAGGMAVAFIAIGTVLQRSFRTLRRLSRFLDEWEGDGPGRSLPERVGHLEQDMSDVKDRLLGRTTDDPVTG